MGTRNYINQANLNILNGALAGTMRFSPGLNLIGGENGTFKTKLLQQLRSGAGTPNIQNSQLRIQSISPKRNSERRAAQQIWQQFRQQNRTLDNVLSERISAQINDSGFDNYPSLGDLFYLIFENRTKDGGDRRKHMEMVINEFNGVIRSIFQQYSIISKWDDASGAPDIRIQKNATTEFPIEGLSLGEQEILGLVTSIHAARDRVDVFLIDEPEVHLNWHLEERLFAFLDELCETYQKQAIVVTHSRAMFTPRFLPKAQFLRWNGEKVEWGPHLTAEQHRRIAGEAIEIIKLGNFSKPTFFVEDSAHVRLIEALARCFSVSCAITQCDNSPNVKSIFKLSEIDGGWPLTYFLVDGDNEGNPYPASLRFIHLPVYCSDNFLLHPEYLSQIFSVPQADIQRMIRDAIVSKRDKILKRNRFFAFLFDQLQPSHITYERLMTLDASEIIDDVANALGSNAVDLTSRVVQFIHANGRLGEHFSESLIDAIRSSVETASSA